MRLKLFTAAVAALAIGTVGAQGADLSARMPVKAAPFVPTFSWTGAYIGAHLGYGWSASTYTYAPTPDWSLNSKPDGILGGGQIGYNYQFGTWVLGAEADFSWTGIKGTDIDAAPAYFGDRYESKIDWTSTITGRIGYAFDRSLLYVKGGAAFAHTKLDYQRAGSTDIGHASRTSTGWTIGGGLEYAFAPQWSARLEYNYMDFGNHNLRMNEANGSWWDMGLKQDMHVVKAGINFRPW